MASITTIIPTYRRPQMLRRAVRSVLAQSYPDFQVCVFDDASGDETASVVSQLASHDSRVKYFCWPRNLGDPGNKAAALPNVACDFFNILDDDDFLVPDFFAAAVKAFDKYPAAFAFFGRELFWDGLEPQRTRVYYDLGRTGLLKPPELAVELLLRNQVHNLSSLMFRREVLDSAGGIDPTMSWSDDLDLILRVLVRYPAVLDDTLCVVVCSHPGQRSATEYFPKYVRAIPRIMGKLEHDTNIAPVARAAVCAALRAAFRRQVLISALAGAALGEHDKLEETRQNLAGDRLSAVVRAAAALSRVPLFPRALRAVRRMRMRVRKDPNCDAYLASIDGWLERLSAA